jgi:hypothetical protein
MKQMVFELYMESDTYNSNKEKLEQLLNEGWKVISSERIMYSSRKHAGNVVTKSIIYILQKDEAA